MTKTPSPSLGPIQCVGLPVGILYRTGLHTSRVRSMVGLRQSKAADQFSRGCVSGRIWALSTATRSATKPRKAGPHTQARQVLFLLFFRSEIPDWVHDQGALNTHGGSIARVHTGNVWGVHRNRITHALISPAHSTGNASQKKRHINHTCTSVDDVLQGEEHTPENV